MQNGCRLMEWLGPKFFQKLRDSKELVDSK